MDKTYYVYRHTSLNTGNPFYIGIGGKKENYNSLKSEYLRAYHKTRRSKGWKEIADGSNYLVEILFEHNDYKVIKEKEKEFIKLYGRIDLESGTLCNLTKGGQGSVGYKFTPEQLFNLSQAHLGIKNANKGKKMSESSKKLMSEKAKLRVGKLNSFYGKTHSEDLLNTKRKKVNQLNINGELIKTYNSISEAALCIGGDFRLISAVCHKKRITHKGFKWEFNQKTGVGE